MRRSQMRPLRAGDIGVLAFVLVTLLPVIVGGAYIVWFAFDRYSLGVPGGLLASVWAYSWSLVLRQTVEGILVDDRVQAHR
jgi:hypothetical protein